MDFHQQFLSLHKNQTSCLIGEQEDLPTPIGPSIAINGLFIITSPNVKIDNEYCTISEVFQHI